MRAICLGTAGLFTFCSLLLQLSSKYCLMCTMLAFKFQPKCLNRIKTCCSPSEIEKKHSKVIITGLKKSLLFSLMLCTQANKAEVIERTKIEELPFLYL